jgi:hypothetical protein
MKKLVTLALAGVCALAFLAVADAGTVKNIKSPTVEVQSQQVKESKVVANTISSTYNDKYFTSSQGWTVNYIYSDDITVSSVVFENLKKALNDPYSSLVPSIANEAIATNGFLRYDVEQYGANGDSLNTKYAEDTNVKSPDEKAWGNIRTAADTILPGRGAITDDDTENGINAEDLEKAAAEQESTSEDDIAITGQVLKDDQGRTYFNSTLSVSSSVKWVEQDGVMVKINVVTLNNEKTIIESKKAHKFVSPLVLDITGNGLQASNGQYLPGHPVVEDRVILADFYGDGFEIGMEWVGPQDGLLVAPKADGSVDMSCLFGSAGGYDNGYEKLSLHDTNNDRVVNGEELNGLSIWQDANGNGRAEAGELKTVQELGITSISLAEKNYVSSFTMNGETHKMWDWWPNAMEVVKVAVK